MHNTRFENWCRLCAKSEGCSKDITANDVDAPDLRLIIEKHFSLQIELNENAPTTICDGCHEYLLKLVEFKEIVLQSQSIFECIDIVNDDDVLENQLEVSTFCEEETEDEIEDPIQKDFLCAQCGETLQTDLELSAHKQSHVLPAKLSCDICGALFGKAFSLRNHRNLVHSNIRPFICDECGKAFKRSGDLTRHKEFHRDYTPFACRICDKKFTSKLVAKMHEKNHSDETFMCNVCGLELKTMHTLRGHMQTHSDKMHFECNYCGKKFRYKKNLNCHLVTHTGVQPFSCTFCQQAFSLRWNCRTHLKKIHPIEMAEYEKEGKATVVTNMVKQKFACGRREARCEIESILLDDDGS